MSDDVRKERETGLEPARKWLKPLETLAFKFSRGQI